MRCAGRPSRNACRNASLSIYADATFEIDGNRLPLHYTTYPLDAPVPTRQTFRRVGRR
jgi:hypothetical protein